MYSGDEKSELNAKEIKDAFSSIYLTFHCFWIISKV